MKVFKNREPKWNAESQMYQLDFRERDARVVQNIQLTIRDSDQSKAELLMGKVDDNKFNVDTSTLLGWLRSRWSSLTAQQLDDALERNESILTEHALRGVDLCDFVCVVAFLRRAI